MKAMAHGHQTITLQIPFRIVKRGGRKEMQVPQDAPRQQHLDTTLLKALARAIRWKRMLDAGEFATIADLARHENIARSYLTRVLHLTMLAPNIIETILDARQPADVSLQNLRDNLPTSWALQQRVLKLG